MSGRWFVSSVRAGAGAAGAAVTGGRAVFKPTVKLRRDVAGTVDELDFPGPMLPLLGPGDVTGFDRSLVVREEPPAGCPTGVSSYLAGVEFGHADLPWLLSPGPDAGPWLVLLVLREEEGSPRPGRPMPVVTVPPAALPDLADSWAWAHVEARLTDGVTDPRADVVADVRVGTDRVVSRLICPRRLAPDAGWVACVVPATAAGVAAGLGRPVDPAAARTPAWTAGQAAPVELPVYHWWTFRTGPAGTFEELSRLVQPVSAAELPGFGSRTVDVRRPWPHADLLPDAPETLTVALDGALRVPGTATPDEAWSDPASRQRFRELLTDRLNAPGAALTSSGQDGGEEPDRDEQAVAPPLLGSHHSGAQTLPATGWMATANLQVRRRVGAAIGARYVQLEQEFLMARAWEQLGAIRLANRLLAAGELAAEIGDRAQRRHLDPLDPGDLARTVAPLRDRVAVAVAGGVGTLGGTLRRSAVPDGAASTAFARLTRVNGGLARRLARVAEQVVAAPEVVTEGLAGTEVLRRPVAWLTALPDAGPGRTVRPDGAGQSATATLTALLQGQQMLFARRPDQGALAGLAAVAGELAAGNAAGAPTMALAAPMVLRGLRREVNAVEVGAAAGPVAAPAVAARELADSVLAGLRPGPLQLRRLSDRILAPDMIGRLVVDPRPLRPVLAHPRFAVPMAAELLTRWPEWAVPGITGFPANSVTLLETNPPFVEAMLVGLNQEFNRELLWREFPTDQRGTPFARFWPTGRGAGADPDVDEIARWAPTDELGTHDRTGGKSLLVLLVRADVLRRFPGTVVLAARAVGGRLPDDGTGEWLEPTFLLPVDGSTALYAFELTAERAQAEQWFFVLREPMRGTSFGFDLTGIGPARTEAAIGVEGAVAAVPYRTWADLTWDQVPVDGRGFVQPRVVGGRPPTPPERPGADPPVWGRDSADVARIALQRPFQVAFFPDRLLRRRP